MIASRNALCAPAIDAKADPLASMRLHAVAALDAARAEMVRMATTTDDPDARDIDAADYLDAAHDLLTRATTT